MLSNRIVVVTGASRGLGEIIARDLASQGAKLALVARTLSALERVSAACPQSRCFAADISVAEDRERVLNEIEREMGPIDILVNNAGIEITVGFLDHTSQDITSTLATNLIAPIELSRLILPKMIARKTGVIVNVSSMSGKGPTPYNSVYAAAKHGLNGFTSSLAMELVGTGVHAGVVCPGFVGETGMWASTGVKAPWVLREVSPKDVAAAVRGVIGGQTEVLVTAGPIRPLLAIQELFPGLRYALMSRFGIIGALKARASATLQAKDNSGVQGARHPGAGV